MDGYPCCCRSRSGARGYGSGPAYSMVGESAPMNPHAPLTFDGLGHSPAGLPFHASLIIDYDKCNLRCSFPDRSDDFLLL
jgi:hypothetical protein